MADIKRQGAIFWWAVASAAGMLLGAFGPWISAFGTSISGTGGSNDGWLVVIAAGCALAALYEYARQPRKLPAFAVLVAGAGGAAVTIYDRSNVSSKLSESGELASALVQIGWGLNLAMVASVSLGIAGLALAGSSRTPETFSDSMPGTAATPVSDRMYRECPHCKEPMRRDATVCPHCRMDSEAWTAHDGAWWTRDTTGEWQYLDEATNTWKQGVSVASSEEAVESSP